MAKGDLPSYFFHAMHKGTNEKSRIGSAWNQPDGSISIALNPFITLESHTELVLRLFPNREAGGATSHSPSPASDSSQTEKAATAYRNRKDSGKTLQSDDLDSDDIPF